MKRSPKPSPKLKQMLRDLAQKKGELTFLNETLSRAKEVQGRAQKDLH